MKATMTGREFWNVLTEAQREECRSWKHAQLGPDYAWSITMVSEGEVEVEWDSPLGRVRTPVSSPPPWVRYASMFREAEAD